MVSYEKQGQGLRPYPAMIRVIEPQIKTPDRLQCAVKIEATGVRFRVMEGLPAGICKCAQ
jgi:hypothetical protein